MTLHHAGQRAEANTLPTELFRPRGGHPSTGLLRRVTVVNLHEVVVVCWLLNVPATRECISGMDLLRQFYVLPH